MIWNLLLSRCIIWGGARLRWMVGPHPWPVDGLHMYPGVSIGSDGEVPVSSIDMPWFSVFLLRRVVRGYL